MISFAPAMASAAVGTSLAVVFGPARFEEFLHGFHEIDEYFANTPFEKNVVVLLGMLNVWYRNFFKVASHAVLPYDQYLHRFPAYLQQLTMEVSVDVTILVLSETTTFRVTSQVVVAETIIVGAVPDTFLQTGKLS